MDVYTDIENSNELECQLPTATESSEIALDKPITAIEQDELMRGDFIKAAARAIQGWKTDDSLSIGLFGRWGEGKTSTKNLLVAEIKSLESEWRVVEFNPWQWSDASKLHDAFFDEIGVALGKTSRANAQRLSNSWRRYAARLKGAAALLDETKKLVQIAFGFCSVLFLIAVIHPSRILLGIFALLLIAPALFKWLAEAAVNLAEVVFPGDASTRKSIEDLKVELSSELKSSSPVLVVMDDLDRLSPKDLVAAIQLIKANGDLPRLVYLLIGDRNILAEHLTSELKVDGSAFLEKIIQIPLDLPHATQQQIEMFLFAHLNSILRRELRNDEFDSARWGTVYRGGLRPYFTTLRAVRRFAITFAFYVSILRENEALGVNPVDLISIEALRVFEPLLYQKLRANRYFLTTYADAHRLDKTAAEIILKSIEDAASPAHKEDALAVVRELFPLANPNRPGTVSNHSISDWYQKFRVCSEEWFEVYFRFDASSGDLSRGDLDHLLESTSTRYHFTAALRNLQIQEKLDKAIRHLGDLSDRIPLENARAVIDGTCDMSDWYSDKSPEMFGTSIMMYAEWFVASLFRRIANPEDMKQVIYGVVETSRHLNLPARLLLRSFLKKDEGRDPLVDFSDSEVAELKEMFCARIRQKANENPKMFFAIGAPGLMLNLWDEWSGNPEPHEFVEAQMGTVEGVTSFLAAMVHSGHSSVLTKSGGTERSYLLPSELARFVSLEQLRERVSEITDSEKSELTSSQADSIELFNQALRRISHGKAENPFHGHGFEDEY